ncbi:hypothetical protein CNEO4_620034 [Clostridium neonatale]|uniref:hypothetical protein n=1 Tax=Clostridium neonatale TaxID=137838 RepID=UPI00291BC073|nr:hypothetical protein [Clostridium neonatale]CAI3674180.1 hypothetical protein CNEO4_620034 [Clostridium neonatale]
MENKYEDVNKEELFKLVITDINKNEKDDILLRKKITFEEAMLITNLKNIQLSADGSIYTVIDYIYNIDYKGIALFVEKNKDILD